MTYLKMETSERIEHMGIVTDIHDGLVHVSFIARSACSECHAKGYCLESDSMEKSVDVTDRSGKFHKGETVNIVMKESLGYRAVLLGFVLPFLVLILVLILVQALTGNELKAGLFALAALVPYYLLLALFKNHLKNTFSFQLEKLSGVSDE
jgi:sigma-E factor negative regulatory protein RseC